MTPLLVLVALPIVSAVDAPALGPVAAFALRHGAATGAALVISVAARLSPAQIRLDLAGSGMHYRSKVLTTLVLASLLASTLLDPA